MAVFTVIAKDSLSLPATTVQWGTHGSAPISQSYDHLCIKISARYSAAGSAGALFDIVYNSHLTDASYSTTQLLASTLTPTSTRGDGRHLAAVMPTSSFLANTFGTTIIWIPHYSNTANYKQMLSQSVAPNNTANGHQPDDEWALRMVATMFHENTDAIDEIRMVAGGGNDFVANSTFTLYGILGA